MNKNSFWKISISIIILVFFGCQEKSGIVDQESSSLDKTGDYYVLNFEDGMNAIEDATLDKNMNFNPDFDGKDFYFDRRHEHRTGFRGKGLRLGIIFSQLDLTEEQKESINTIFEDNRECVAVPFEQFREAAKVIMDSSRVKIDAIRDSVHAGELTRIEARLKIKKINEFTRSIIENNEVCIQAKEEICNCNQIMMENIELLLDENQLLIWREWLSKFPKPCENG